MALYHTELFNLSKLKFQHRVDTSLASYCNQELPWQRYAEPIFKKNHFNKKYMLISPNLA